MVIIIMATTVTTVEISETVGAPLQGLLFFTERIVKIRQISRQMWLKFAVFIALGHLLLVAIGAAELELPSGTWWSRAIDIYGEISGSSSGYGFFSPGVTSQIRASFDIVEKDSTRLTQELKDQSNREVDLRLGDIVEQFLGDEDRQDPMGFQRQLSASLSGAVFAHHEGAKSVTIRLEKFTPVSMEDFRNGMRGQWTPLYSAEFINRRSARR